MTLFAEASEAVQIITVISSVAATAIAGVVSIYVARIAAGQDAAAKEVREVKETVAGTAAASTRQLAAVKKTADATHKAVNSGLGVQLRLHAVGMRRLAQLTGLPEDARVAEAAEQAAAEHERTQRTLAANTPAGG